MIAISRFRSPTHLYWHWLVGHPLPAPRMATLTLPVRHTREVTDIGVECREENFRLGHREWTLPLADCALVMVDCWDTHVVVSHLERGGRIAEQHILPVLEAFREAGMPVVHAPSPGVAERFPEFMQFHDEMPPKPAVRPHPSAPTGHCRPELCGSTP